MKKGNFVKTRIPTGYGPLDFYVWPAASGQEPIAIATPTLDVTKPVLVRVHSECITGDNFGSLKCDCGPQKEEALKKIAASDNGVFVYHRQEGRGIGLYEKIKAYALQERGHDTYSANVALGHAPDARDYTSAVSVLKELSITHIALMTNNPEKVSALASLGLHVTERVPLQVVTNVHNEKYLDTKRVRFGHHLRATEVPYVGVSGIVTSDDAESLLSAIEHTESIPRAVYAGITIRAGDLVSQPRIQEIRAIIKEINDRGLCVPIIHYSFRGSPDPVRDIEVLRDLFPGVSHLQLNDVSGNYRDLCTRASASFNIIIPLTPENASTIRESWLIELIKTKNARVLIDPSGGQGVHGTDSFYQQMLVWCRDSGIEKVGVAGGFGAGGKERLSVLQSFFPSPLSVDAESKVHQNNRLSEESTQAYLAEFSS